MKERRRRTVMIILLMSSSSWWWWVGSGNMMMPPISLAFSGISCRRSGWRRSWATPARRSSGRPPRFRRDESSSSSSSSSSLGDPRTTTATSVAASRVTAPAGGEAQVLAPTRFVPWPFPYHYELDLNITALTTRGWGIGRVSLSATTASSLPPHLGDADAAEPERQHPSGHSNDGDDDEDTVTTSLDFFSPLEEEEEETNDDHDHHHQKEERLWVVMVPHVIPGETVRVRIFRNFRSYSEADLVQLLGPHPTDRVLPLCPLFEAGCGGCQLQHLSITAQRVWKTRQVQQALQQYGLGLAAGPGTVEVLPTRGTAHDYHYRSKLTPHFQAPLRRRPRDGGGGGGEPPETFDPGMMMMMIQAIGFQKLTSRQIVDVPYCPIATEPINAAYARLRQELRSPSSPPSPAPRRRRTGATLLLRQANIEDDVVTTDHKTYLTTQVGSLKFTYQAGNFFQNNYYVLPLMVRDVVEQASQPNPSGQRLTHLVDCYCGSGLFALAAAAAHFETVVGIEINDQAVREARANAVQNDLSARCFFMAAPAEDIFQHLRGGHRHTNSTSTTTSAASSPLHSDNSPSGPAPDLNFPRNQTAVVLDPPRKGCSTDFLRQLVAFSPQRIVYMSCDPVTQARDAAVLVSTGPYHITYVQPYDLFPQTRHIECLMILERHT